MTHRPCQWTAPRTQHPRPTSSISRLLSLWRSAFRKARRSWRDRLGSRLGLRLRGRQSLGLGLRLRGWLRFRCRQLHRLQRERGQSDRDGDDGSWIDRVSRTRILLDHLERVLRIGFREDDLDLELSALQCLSGLLEGEADNIGDLGLLRLRRWRLGRLLGILWRCRLCWRCSCRRLLGSGSSRGDDDCHRTTHRRASACGRRLSAHITRGHTRAGGLGGGDLEAIAFENGCRVRLGQADDVGDQAGLRAL